MEHCLSVPDTNSVIGQNGEQNGGQNGRQHGETVEQHLQLQELSSQENGHLIPPGVSKAGNAGWLDQGRKNWRNVLVVVLLWITYFLCQAAYSMISPFFPQIVSFIGHLQRSISEGGRE